MTNKGMEHTKLRASQLETLRVAAKLEDGFTGAFEAADLAWMLRARPSTASARSRLERLVGWGYLNADRSTPHRVFYTLTDKGREAIR
jgi:DNA-binding MarR family transcriptional regulator